MNLPLPPPAYYKETLEDATLGYLRRHRNEHLHCNQALFTSTVNYLTSTYAANLAEAENTVARVWGNLRSQEAHRYLDISLSSASAAVLVDSKTGLHWVVPVSDIFEHFVDTPARTRLRMVDHH